MRIKRYEGQYVHEVIGQIKEELGQDAVVLHTRWRNPAGIKKLLGRPQVEVWAGAREDVGDLEGGDQAARALALRQAIEQNSCGLDVTDSDEPARPEPAGNGHLAPPAPRPAVAVAVPLPSPAPVPAADELDAVLAPDAAADDLTIALLAQFNSALERLEEKVDALQAPPAEPVSEDSPRMRALVASGVDPEVAREIAAAAEGRSVAEVLLETFQCGREPDWSDGPKVIAVVGPSGVGKTTTVAKLAGHLAFGRGARVMLASTDTQRVGAFEQIRAMGQLMELPTAALRNPSEAQAKLQMARQAHDVILVDTAACTPQDGDAWDRLLDTLIAVEPDEIHVVVAASMRTSEAARCVEYFRQVLPLHGAVVTKLDEASQAGLLVDLAWRCLLPITWLGTGHDVPGDLEQARPDPLLERVWSPQLTVPTQE